MAITRPNANLGVTIHDETSTQYISYNLETSATLLIGTAPGAVGAVFAKDQPTFFNDENRGSLGSDGTLPDAITAFLAQARGGSIGRLYVCRVDPGADDSETAGHIASSLGSFIDLCQSLYGEHPGMVCAPGFTHLPGPGGGINVIAAAMESTLLTYRTFGFLDCPDGTIQEVIDYRETLTQKCVGAIYPWVHLASNDALVGPSVFFAGLCSALEASGFEEDKGGPHLSPLNKPLVSVGRLSKEISHGTPNSTATLFMKNGVNTIIKAQTGGYKAWGDETGENTAVRQFSIGNTRLAFNLERNIKALCERVIGKNLSPVKYANIIHSVGTFLRNKKALGWFDAAEIRQSNAATNTSDETGSMKIDFDLDAYTPIREVDIYSKLETIHTGIIRVPLSVIVS